MDRGLVVAIVLRDYSLYYRLFFVKDPLRAVSHLRWGSVGHLIMHKSIIMQPNLDDEYVRQNGIDIYCAHTHEVLSIHRSQFFLQWVMVAG